MGLEIGGAELPVLVRGEDAFAQAFELFLWRYLQINLDQVNIVGGQLVFKVGNLLQALGALCRLDKAVAQVADHAFIRAAIENPNTAGSRQPPPVARQKIFFALSVAGQLEIADIHALRVEAAKQVTDHAVLA